MSDQHSADLSGPAAGEIRAPFVDEDLDHPNRVLLTDIIFQAVW
jgi:hypothetical protein